MIEMITRTEESRQIARTFTLLSEKQVVYDQLHGSVALASVALCGYGSPNETLACLKSYYDALLDRMKTFGRYRR